MQIEKFKIKKLHGYKNYELKFKDNKLILVGENGSGKTTVLRILFYLLTGKWCNLLEYKFEQISIKFKRENFSVKREQIEKYWKNIGKILIIL